MRPQGGKQGGLVEEVHIGKLLLFNSLGRDFEAFMHNRASVWEVVGQEGPMTVEQMHLQMLRVNDGTCG